MIRKSFIALAAFGVLALSGCQIYFGDSNDGSDDCGFFGDCGGSDVAPEPAGPGSECATNYDCMAGCFCTGRGTCEEAGFCAADADCAAGFECEDSRASCVPVGSETNCLDSAVPCPAGSYCERSSGVCIDSWLCNSDADCSPGMECAVDNATCVPLSCTSDDQCLEGCYCDGAYSECVESGFCVDDRDCAEGMRCDTARNTCDPDVVPTCDQLTNEAECLARTDCGALYTGVNCTSPDGQSCTSGDANCTCESFSYAGCAASE